MQAGKQLEHITGGLIKAGFHEVVVNDATVKVRSGLTYDVTTPHLTAHPTQVIERVKSEGTRPVIRISSTFFWHLSSDYDLAPIPELESRRDEIRKEVGEESAALPDYPLLKVGTQVQK